MATMIFDLKLLPFVAYYSNHTMLLDVLIESDKKIGVDLVKNKYYLKVYVIAFS